MNNAKYPLTIFIQKPQLTDGGLSMMDWKDERVKAQRKSNSVIDFYYL